MTSAHHNKERLVEPVVLSHVKTLSVGTYIAKRIVEAGAKHYFTVPGDFTLALLDEFLKEENLTMIGCCNELNAGYAADGYCRATKGLGVAMVTYMVGGLSIINAAAGAYSDDLPFLIISGGPNSHDGQDRHLIHHTIGEIELYQAAKCFEPVVAKVFVVRHPKDAAIMIDEAISLCLSRRKPVYLEIACNLSTYKIFEPFPIKFDDLSNPNVDYISDPQALAAAVKDIQHLLNIATKPVLIGGARMRRSGVAEDFMELASKMQCALGITPDAKSLISEDHPCYIGCWWGSVSSAHVQETVESSDLVLFAGAIFNDYTTVGWTAEIPESKSICLNHDNVNICGRHIANVYMQELIKELILCAPIKESSLVTYHRYKDGSSAPVVSTPAVAFSSFHLLYPSFHLRYGPELPLTLQFISGQIQSHLNSESSLVIETGDCWFIGQNLQLPPGCVYHVQMQYGSIGWAVGATLGVAMAVGAKRKVMALIGDGSFQVTAQELSTMIRYGVKATILLFNNNGYTIEVQIHDGPYNDIQDWKYADLINTFNAPGLTTAMAIKATTNMQLYDAMRKADSFEGVTLIECCIARDDCTANLIKWGGKVAHSNGRKP